MNALVRYFTSWLCRIERNQAVFLDKLISNSYHKPPLLNCVSIAVFNCLSVNLRVRIIFVFGSFLCLSPQLDKVTDITTELMGLGS